MARSDGPKLPASRSSQSSLSPVGLPQGREALRQHLISLGRTEAAKEASRRLRAIRGNFAIALDATGSMSGVIEMAKQTIEEIMRRIFKEASQHVKIQFLVYRDYCDGNDVLEYSNLTEDSQELTRWLARVRAFGGGGNTGEAINEALQAVYANDEFDAVIVAGDEPQLSRQELNAVGKGQLKTAIELAQEFGARKVPIHTFPVGDRNDTARDFKLIAEKSGGQTGMLDGSEAMIDMAVMAILAALKGRESVSAYMRNYQLTDSSKKFGALLLSPPRK